MTTVSHCFVCKANDRPNKSGALRRISFNIEWSLFTMITEDPFCPTLLCNACFWKAYYWENVVRLFFPLHTALRTAPTERVPDYLQSVFYKYPPCEWNHSAASLKRETVLALTAVTPTCSNCHQEIVIAYTNYPGENMAARFSPWLQCENCTKAIRRLTEELN